MRKNTRNSLFSNSTIKILPFILFSCVYYNTFYNAEVNYKKAEKIIEQTPQADSGDKKIPTQANKLLAQVIENSNIVIDSYPNSKYIDDAYFIIGKASFLRQEFFNAEKHFKKLIDFYPDSEYKYKAQIWLIYTYLKMNDVSLAKEKLAKLENFDNDEDQFLINNIFAEISIWDKEPFKAYSYYNNCIDMTNSNSQKTSIYLKLLNISKEYNHLDSLIIYLDKLSEYTTGSMRKDIKLDWIKYNREVKRFDEVLVEIDIMLAIPDYSSIYIKLELERAKIYLDQNDFASAKIFLTELADKYSRKSESAEALYHLGNIALLENFDMDLALEYFEKSKKDRKSSLYGKRSRDMINRINDYKNLNEELDYLLNNPNPSDVGEEGFSKNMNMQMRPKPKSKINMTPDSLLFTISEKLLFDFAKLENAKVSYEKLIDSYPESKFRPQALYVLNFYFPNEGWGDILELEYPESKFNINFKNDKLSSDDIDLMRDRVWDICDNSYNLCSKEFLELYNKENDAQSLYLYAFINHNYLYEPEIAINSYNECIKICSDDLAQDSEERLDEIKENIDLLIALENQKIDYYYAIKSLYASEETFLSKGEDPIQYTIAKIDKVIEGGFTSYKSSAQLIKTQLNKLINFKQEIELQSNLEMSDSLFFEIGNIYQFDFAMYDSAKVYFELITDTTSFPFNLDDKRKSIVIDEVFNKSSIEEEEERLDFLMALTDLFIDEELLNTNKIPPNSIIAVVDFEAGGISEEDTKLLTDKFIEGMVALDKYSIVERQDVDKILAEQKTQSINCSDQICAVEIGQLLNADYMIVGQVSRLGATFSIDARVVDVEKGLSILSSEFNYGVEDDKETIDILLTKGVDKIVTDLASLFKSDISSDELENLNINLDSLNSNIIIPKINNNLDTLKSKSDINEQ